MERPPFDPWSRSCRGRSRLPRSHATAQEKHGSMGLFDRFKSAPKTEAKPRAKGAASKWADRMEKRAQNYDRQEAIQALSDMESGEAVPLLLRRFTFHIDPSITDQP